MYPGLCPGLITHRQISRPASFSPQPGQILHWTAKFQDEKRGELIAMNIKVPWSVPWPDYSPPDFTAPFVLTAAWADPPLGNKDFRMKREGSS
jgi:hypothetical protein